MPVPSTVLKRGDCKVSLQKYVFLCKVIEFNKEKKSQYDVQTQVPCLLVQDIQEAWRMNQVTLSGSNNEPSKRKGELWVGLKG